MNRDRLRRPTGVTLVELLVTIIIIMIVMAAAVPSFSMMIAQNRITTTVNNLIGTLSAARSMAVTGRGPATVCSNNGGACGSASQWNAGVLLFIDRDTNQAINGTEHVALRQEKVVNLNVSANVSAVSFLYDGSARVAANDAPAQWLFCDPDGRAQPRIVILQPVGAINMRKPASCAM